MSLEETPGGRHPSWLRTGDSAGGRWVASRVVSLVRPWFDAAIGNLPEKTRLWDAHTHTGQKDPDGVTGTAERLIEKLRGAAHSGAVVSTNQDPNGYGEANDRILTEAENSEGALIPFLRVDRNEGAAAAVEVERSLNRGHGLGRRAPPLPVNDQEGQSESADFLSYIP